MFLQGTKKVQRTNSGGEEDGYKGISYIELYKRGGSIVSVPGHAGRDNGAPYDAWFIKVKEVSEKEELLSPSEYEAFVASEQ